VNRFSIGRFSLIEALIVAAILGITGGIIAYNLRNTPKGQPEFTLYDVPSDYKTSGQGMQMYRIVGHGKTCYVAGFGSSKVLLWCEDSQEGQTPPAR
jgi:hypothetical protein